MAATRMSFMAMLLVYPFVMVTENGSMLDPGFRFLKLTPMGFLTESYGTSRNSCMSLSTYTLFEVPLKLKSGPKPQHPRLQDNLLCTPFCWWHRHSQSCCTSLKLKRRLHPLNANHQVMKGTAKSSMVVPELVHHVGAFSESTDTVTQVKMQFDHSNTHTDIFLYWGLNCSPMHHRFLGCQIH